MIDDAGRAPATKDRRWRFNASRGDVHDERPWAQFAYVSRKLRERVAAFAAEADLRPGARVLDFGCATKPYVGLFPADVTVEGADLEGNAAAEHVIEPSGRLLVDDESFDAVLSTQVLEHVEAPATYLSEALRVLRPGGRMLLTTHGIMYVHRDPVDYWRWTSDGLSKVIREQGFETLAVDGLLGLAPAALQVLQDAIGHKVPRRLRRGYMFLFQQSVKWSDGRYSDAARRDNSLVIAVDARRPGA